MVCTDDQWLLTLDFVPLFLDPQYNASYISSLNDVKERHNGIMAQLPDSFYDGKRWTSNGLLFASSNMLPKVGVHQRVDVDDAIEQEVKRGCSPARVLMLFSWNAPYLCRSSPRWTPWVESSRPFSVHPSV